MYYFEHRMIFEPREQFFLDHETFIISDILFKLHEVFYNLNLRITFQICKRVISNKRTVC
jgi:hypothetical protein